MIISWLIHWRHRQVVFVVLKKAPGTIFDAKQEDGRSMDEEDGGQFSVGWPSEPPVKLPDSPHECGMVCIGTRPVYDIAPSTATLPMQRAPPLVGCRHALLRRSRTPAFAAKPGEAWWLHTDTVVEMWFFQPWSMIRQKSACIEIAEQPRQIDDVCGGVVTNCYSWQCTDSRHRIVFYPQTRAWKITEHLHACRNPIGGKHRHD